MESKNASKIGSDKQNAASALPEKITTISEKCINCDFCKQECEFLKKYGKPKEIADAIEHTITLALLEERKRCADVAFKCCEEDMDKAHKVAEEINRVNTALIANLSAMR